SFAADETHSIQLLPPDAPASERLRCSPRCSDIAVEFVRYWGRFRWPPAAGSEDRRAAHCARHRVEFHEIAHSCEEVAVPRTRAGNTLPSSKLRRRIRRTDRDRAW